VIRWVWIAGLILLFYVLSTGPACKLEEKGVVSENVLHWVYVPLWFLYEHCRPAHVFFDWYLPVWGVS
jgi:hypothetical protein